MMGTPNPQSCPNTCEFSKSAYIWTKGAEQMPDFGPGPKLHLLKSRTNTVVYTLCCKSMRPVDKEPLEGNDTSR